MLKICSCELGEWVLPGVWHSAEFINNCSGPLGLLPAMGTAVRQRGDLDPQADVVHQEVEGAGLPPASLREGQASPQPPFLAEQGGGPPDQDQLPRLCFGKKKGTFGNVWEDFGKNHPSVSVICNAFSKSCATLLQP